MLTEESKLNNLRTLLCEQTGIEPKTPKDFDLLSGAIQKRTKCSVSSTTLKRLWGYIHVSSDRKIRISILNILTQAVGYTSWEAFMAEDTETNGSDFLTVKTLKTEELEKGALVRILWDPGRCIEVKHLGNGEFTVISSMNSKLMAGDKFQCAVMAEKQELLFTDLKRHGMEPCPYVCGKAGGIHFEVL